MLLTACQQFLGKRENDIRRIAQETLEGHQRAIMGNMTVEVVRQSQAIFYLVSKRASAARALYKGESSETSVLLTFILSY